EARRRTPEHPEDHSRPGDRLRVQQRGSHERGCRARVRLGRRPSQEGPSADLLMARHKNPLERPTERLFREAFMNLQPLGDRLIVEVLDEEELTVSGIVLPDTAREKPQRGRVLAVGPGARDEDGKYIKMD